QARPRAGWHRHRDRSRRGAFHHAADVLASLQREPARSRDLRACVGRADWRHTDGELRARAPRRDPRSDPRAARRLADFWTQRRAMLAPHLRRVARATGDAMSPRRPRSFGWVSVWSVSLIGVALVVGAAAQTSFDALQFGAARQVMLRNAVVAARAAQRSSDSPRFGSMTPSERRAAVDAFWGD